MTRGNAKAAIGRGLVSNRRLNQRERRPTRRLRFETLEERHLLAPFVVTNLNDAPANTPQSVGTLRQAIYDANLQSDADIIQFDANLSGTLELSVMGDAASRSALAISSPITIQGNAAGVTIGRCGGETMRLFHLTPGSSLTLEFLSLRDGLALGVSPTFVGGDGLGGAILSQNGTLTLRSSTLYANVARGSNGVGSAPGGAGLGGAVYSEGGIVTITNSTLSGNAVVSGTGGSSPSSFGGGVYVHNGAISIYNSTITENSATTGRGVYVVGDGGTATASIYSSIIGSADAPLGYDFFTRFDSGGTVQVAGSNNFIRRQNDFEAITISMDDPLLGALASNGGPTMTHALAENSPVVNQGINPLSLATDQRSATFCASWAAARMSERLNARRRSGRRFPATTMETRWWTRPTLSFGETLRTRRFPRIPARTETAMDRLIRGTTPYGGEASAALLGRGRWSKVLSCNLLPMRWS